MAIMNMKNVKMIPINPQEVPKMLPYRMAHPHTSVDQRHPTPGLPTPGPVNMNMILYYPMEDMIMFYTNIFMRGT